MTTHRSWFPFILVGLSAALLAVVVVAYVPRSTETTDSFSDSPAVVTPTGTEYEAAVRQIIITQALSSGSPTESAQAAYDALLALRVPTAYQDVHLQLVLAFGQIAAGEDARGRARLIAVEDTSPWILAQ